MVLMRDKEMKLERIRIIMMLLFDWNNPLNRVIFTISAVLILLGIVFLWILKRMDPFNKCPRWVNALNAIILLAGISGQVYLHIEHLL